MAEDWSVTEGVTLLGKTPARADFIRINHGSASAIAFDEWLQRNLEELVLGGQRTAPPSRFLFAPSGGGEALFGLVAPSRDKAGRSFPVALFVALPAGLARRAPHVIARAGAPFVAAARTLFEGLGTLDHDALKGAVAALEVPAQGAFDDAEREVGEALGRAMPADCVERLFRDSADGVAAAALFTVTSAEREAAPKAAVFECPVQEATDALFWLALASRGAQGPLSFFWTDVAEPGGDGETPAASRLLLCSAPPPAQTLLHLAAGKPKPGKLQVLSGALARPAAKERDAGRSLLEKLLGSESLAEFIGSPS
jgi:type VI secretion system protein ImpM